MWILPTPHAKTSLYSRISVSKSQQVISVINYRWLHQSAKTIEPQSSSTLWGVLFPLHLSLIHINFECYVFLKHY